MPKRVFSIFLSLFFFFNINLLYAKEQLYIEPLIREAKEKNPEIMAAFKRYEAAKARIPLAKSLDDPILSFGFQRTKGSPFQLNNTPTDERMLSFSQFLPFFGKLSLKGKISLVESQIFASEYKAKELEVINDLKNAYYDLFMNYKEIELNRESLILLEGIAKVAESKFTVGEASQEEVYKLHLEVARLNTNIANLEQEKKSKETLINTLLNRDPESPLGIPVLEEQESFNIDIKSLYMSTLLNQPELLTFSYAIERNKYAKSLSQRSFFPDLMAQITERGFSTGTIGPWDLMLAFTLPLWFWTKQRYQVKEAIANLEEAKGTYQAMQNKAFAEVKDLAIKIETAKNKIRLNKNELLPILESSIEVSLAAFRTGKGDFMSLLDNQRMLIETKINYYKSLVDYNINLADLERTVGTDLTKNQEVKDEQ